MLETGVADDRVSPVTKCAGPFWLELKGVAVDVEEDFLEDVCGIYGVIRPAQVVIDEPEDTFMVELIKKAEGFIGDGVSEGRHEQGGNLVFFLGSSGF